MKKRELLAMIESLAIEIAALRRRIEELEARPVVYPFSPYQGWGDGLRYTEKGPNDWPPIVVTNWTTQAEAQHGG